MATRKLAKSKLPEIRLSVDVVMDSQDLTHNDAVYHPVGIERAWGHLLKGWEIYAINYRQSHGADIGEDGVLGPEWGQIGESLRALLNGPTGRLSGGRMAEYISALMRFYSWEPKP